jgi:hypothetical protein
MKVLFFVATRLGKVLICRELERIRGEKLICRSLALFLPFLATIRPEMCPAALFIRLFLSYAAEQSASWQHYKNCVNLEKPSNQ